MSIEWHWVIHIVSIFIFFWLVVLLKLTEKVSNDRKEEANNSYKKYTESALELRDVNTEYNMIVLAIKHALKKYPDEHSPVFISGTIPGEVTEEDLKWAKSEIEKLNKDV